MNATEPYTLERVSSGIAGLDEILEGGLPQGYIYLIQGDSGSGKTTLGLQFALAGVEAGENVLYISLSETKRELQQIAASHGWSLEGLQIHELLPAQAIEQMQSEQTIFHTADVELGEAMENILQSIREIEPDRAVFDSMTEINLLAGGQLPYRRQMLSLRETLTGLNCTALIMNNELTRQERDVHSLVHGALELEQTVSDHGTEQRRLRLAKVRGMFYHSGYHNFKIITGGLEVYPRLRLSPATPNPSWTLMTSDIEALDTLLGGGLHSGSTCLIAGQTGTGKSTLSSQYMAATARRGERAVAFLFDESDRTFFRRAENLNLNLRQFEEQGLIEVQQIDAGNISPGEFSQIIRQSITAAETKMVVIDSLNGYLNAMPHEKLLIMHMHELLAYLNEKDILTLLTITHHGVVEPVTTRDVDLSYLADTVLLLRHFEARSSVRQAISVIKKRHGPHEKMIRELNITATGIEVGEPLAEFSGVLTGRPRYKGDSGKLLDNDNNDESA